MKRALTLVAVIVAVIGCAWFVWLRPSAPQRDALHTREIATRGLAEHLARVFPGRRALVISNPFTQQSNLPREMRDMEEAGLRGLKQGFGDKVSLGAVAFPALRPEAKDNPRAVFIDAETTTPLSYLVADDAFDKLARQYPDCDLIVSLIGLPANLRSVQCWQNQDGPKFALLLPDLRVIGDRAAVRRSLESGKLVAFVLAKPSAAGTKQLSTGEFKTDFERLFLLVTRENAEASVRTFPQLFPAN